VGAQLQQIGDEKETTRAGGCKAAFEQSCDVMFNAVAGNKNLTRFAGAVEDLDLLFGQQAWRKRA
jgi:hypothetical protein